MDPTFTRRAALKTLGVASSALLINHILPLAQAAEATTAEFILPPLTYGYAALEPHFDERTMMIHHQKHHQAYITAANKALADKPILRALTPSELLSKLAQQPEPLATTLRNHVGGHANHSFFWTILSPQGGGAPTGKLAEAITQTFGNFDAFKTQFAEATLKRFGSGWAWLVVRNARLEIETSANQDSPLLTNATPVLGLDVWEHAYYLRYQNRRADFIAAFWHLVDWTQANRYFATTCGDVSSKGLS